MDPLLRHWPYPVLRMEHEVLELQQLCGGQRYERQPGGAGGKLTAELPPPVLL